MKASTQIQPGASCRVTEQEARVREGRASKQKSDLRALSDAEGWGGGEGVFVTSRLRIVHLSVCVY